VSATFRTKVVNDGKGILRLEHNAFESVRGRLPRRGQILAVMARPVVLLREGSGGDGRRQGGEGVIRSYEFLAPATVTVVSERRRLAPYGLQGGEPAGRGSNLLTRAGGAEERLPGKFSTRVRPGDVLRIETPGGGGWGAPDGASGATV